MGQNNEYCHFVLSRRETKTLWAAAPQKYHSKIDFIVDFESKTGYSTKRWRAFNWRLIKAVKWLFINSGFLNVRSMSEDAYDIYKRCLNNIPTIDREYGDDGYIIDYSTVFEILSDFIWLYVSQYENKRRISQRNTLFDDFKVIHIKAFSLYDDLLERKNVENSEYDVVKEAKKRKERIIPGPIFDDNVLRYYKSNNSVSDLSQILYETEDKIKWIEYLYYALIATSVRYEELRKG